MPAIAVRAALLCLLACACLPARAGREHYALDPVHTRVLFAVSHAGFSQALGTVSGTTGTLDFDPDDLGSARVQASVPLARLELGDAKWNAAAAKLLDAGAYPQAVFVSTRVEPVDASHARVFGMLTLHGVTREVELAVTFNQLRRHPLPPFRRIAGFSATAILSRKAFGITQWPSVIGDLVGLRFEVEAVRARESAAERLDANPPPAEDMHPPPDENLPPPPQPRDASGPPSTP